MNKNKTKQNNHHTMIMKGGRVNGTKVLAFVSAAVLNNSCVLSTVVWNQRMVMMTCDMHPRYKTKKQE
jgi:hypothetical protein